MSDGHRKEEEVDDGEETNDQEGSGDADFGAGLMIHSQV